MRGCMRGNKSSQSNRRRNCKRIKAKRKSYHGGGMDEKGVAQAVTTPKTISSYLCCINPRQLEGATKKELSSGTENAK